MLEKNIMLRHSALKVPIGSGGSLTPKYRNKAVGYSPQDWEELKKDENLVQNLNTWQISNSDFEASDLIEDAKKLLIRRINHQNQIEDTVLTRRSGLTTRSGTSSPRPFLTSISRVNSPLLQNPFKENLKNLKEISRFNKQFEDSLLEYYAKYVKTLDDLGNQRDKLRNDVHGLREELKSNQVDLDSCKFTLKIMEKNKKNLKTVEKAAEYFTRKASLREEICSKESRCTELMQDIEQELNKNSKIVEKLDSDCSKIRKELKIIKSALVEHYKKLLHEGKDSRSEGLQWIVKAVWKLGENVQKSDFAKFIDDELSDSILYLAEKTQEIETIAGNSEKNHGRTLLLTTSQEKLNEVHLRLAEASKKIRVKKPKIWILNERKSIVAWKNCEPENKNFRSHLVKFNINSQQQVKELKEKIDLFQEQAIQKVIKKCLLNGYEQKKSVDFKLLIASLIGFDNLEKYNSVIIKFKRDLSEKLALTKTFTFANSKS